jgi:hypothetical protein
MQYRNSRNAVISKPTTAEVMMTLAGIFETKLTATPINSEVAASLNRRFVVAKILRLMSQKHGATLNKLLESPIVIPVPLVIKAYADGVSRFGDADISTIGGVMTQAMAFAQYARDNFELEESSLDAIDILNDLMVLNRAAPFMKAIAPRLEVQDVPFMAG